MAERAKHAFGQSSGIEAAKAAGKIDAFDILFLDGDTDPKIGWLDKNGNTVIVPNKTDLSGVEAEIAKKADAEEMAELSAEVANKANAEEVESKIGEIEFALGEVAKVAYAHEKVKYEITDAPIGTLVDVGEKEIRIMCPKNSAWKKQNVGTNGNPNVYYVTLNTYAPSADCVGYIEHLGSEVDAEILTDLKTDAYGRKYQPTWLGMAEYDAATDAWTYYGASSTAEHYVGWDYQLDWYNADGVMMASDSVRINLSNEDCHFDNKPYYIGKTMSEVEEMIANAVKEATGAIEIVEF